MKRLSFIIMLLLVMQFMAWGQELLNDLNKSISRGNSELIEQHLENIVDITIEEKSSTYSKAQATMVLNDFFKKNKVNSFEITDMGNNGDNMYYIGELDTRGPDYTVYVYTRKKASKEYILEIRIKKD